jgi:hypothetical protein
MIYILEPEVAGELGENTVFENFDNVRLKGERPIVKKLHYQFSGWLGDELLEVTPCFIVTTSLARMINDKNLSGCVFEDVEISLSEDFIEMYPDKTLPDFQRLVPIGKIFVDGNKFSKWSGHDFCITQKSYLVVSEKALQVLRLKQIDNCDITELIEV